MTSPSRGDLEGLGLLALLGTIWGATFPVARVGIDAGANPFVLVALDLGLASIALAALATLRRAPRPDARGLVTSTLIGVLLIGGINLPLFWGEQFATGGAAAIVYATSPLVSIVVARALGTRLNLGRIATTSVALGLLGVTIIALTSIGTGVLTNAWAIGAFGLGAVCQGSGTVLLSRSRPEGEDAWGLTFEMFGGLLAALLALPFLATSLALPRTPSVAFSILFIGLGTLVLGYTVFFELVRRSGPVRANTVTFLNPIVALAVGALAFGESFQWFELVGLAVVLVALGLIERPSLPRAVRARPPTSAARDAGSTANP
jgi:drug/metabolite transporter (DMT)-like permease